MADLVYDDEGTDFSEADGGGWSWLVSVVFGGRVYRWSSATAGEVTFDGELLSASLEADLSDLKVVDEMPVASGASPRTLSVAVFFPPGVSVAEHESRGVVLGGAPAEVALLPAGGGIEDRRPVLVGYVSQPTYGDVDEVVAFTVRAAEQDEDSPYPPARWRITRRTWSSTPGVVNAAPAPSAIGKVYMRVWGEPGVIVAEDGTTTYVPATPTEVVARHNDADTWIADRLLLTSEAVDASTGSVQLMVADNDTADGYKLINAPTESSNDELGEIVTLANVESDGTTPPPEYLQVEGWAACWRYGPAAPIGGQARPGVGDLVLWWLRQSTLQVDWPRSLRAAAALNAFRFDGYVDDATTPLEWLSDHVCDVLPAYLATGPAGVYVVAVPWTRQDVASLASLIEGDGTVERPDGAVQVERDVAPAEITVEWAYDLGAGSYRMQTTVVSAEVADAYDTPELARFSAPARRKSITVQLRHCWNEATARLVAEWTAWRETSARRTVAVDVDSARWAWLQAGDFVSYTDEDLYLDEAQCLVVSVERSDAPWWRMKLLVVE